MKAAAETGIVDGTLNEKITLSLKFWAKWLNPGKEPSSINGESCILDGCSRGTMKMEGVCWNCVNIFWISESTKQLNN